MSIYSIGISALNSAQFGLSTTSHNISNVNTAGFHRQEVVLATNIALTTGSGFLGQGVHVDTVRRVYSQFLDNQVTQAQAQSSHFNSYLSNISQLDNIVADPNAGLSPALQDFFSAVNDLATNPQSIPSRQSLLSDAGALVARFQSLDRRFTEIRDGVNGQIVENVNAINSLAAQLGKLNEQIILQSGSTGQPPNDLLDQRDELVARLNTLVKATVVRQDDGAFNVFIGNGQPLVVGQSVFSLAAVASPDNPEQLEVAYRSGSSTTLLPQGSLTGGALGGLLQFRSEALDPAQNALGRIAITLAETFNAQHRLGQDLNGALGGDFFVLPEPAVISNTGNAGSGVLTGVITDAAALTTSDYRIEFDGANYQVTDLATRTTTTVAPADLADAIPGVTLSLAGVPAAGDAFTVQPTRHGARDIALSATLTTTTIAAAAPAAISADPGNTGTGTVASSLVTDVSGFPLPSDITLTFDAGLGEFVVSGAVPAVANIPYAAGTPLVVNGVTLTINGAPADGDVFTIGNNVNGVSDNRNALLLAALQGANLMEGGTATLQGAYGQLVSQVGNKTAEVQVSAQAEDNLLAQAKASQQSLSGVNLDEEAANLLRYQQSYQAAARVLQIASTLFDTLLGIGN